MADDDESRDFERSRDTLAASDGFAQLAALVFEWHVARAGASAPASRERGSSDARWMSRCARRAEGDELTS